MPDTISNPENTQAQADFKVMPEFKVAPDSPSAPSFDETYSRRRDEPSEPLRDLAVYFEDQIADILRSKGVHDLENLAALKEGVEISDLRKLDALLGNLRELRERQTVPAVEKFNEAEYLRELNSFLDSKLPTFAQNNPHLGLRPEELKHWAGYLSAKLEDTQTVPPEVLIADGKFASRLLGYLVLNYRESALNEFVGVAFSLVLNHSIAHSPQPSLRYIRQEVDLDEIMSMAPNRELTKNFALDYIGLRLPAGRLIVHGYAGFQGGNYFGMEMSGGELETDLANDNLGYRMTGGIIRAAEVRGHNIGIEQHGGIIYLEAGQRHTNSNSTTPQDYIGGGRTGGHIYFKGQEIS